MKIIDRYIGWNVLFATLFAMAVLSFFLVLGNTSRELLNLIVNRNLPWPTVLFFSSLILPFTLTFTIPWAFLAALLLFFGRISADNELVALQACGVSLFRSCAPVLVLAVLLSGICLWINVEASPRAQRRMFSAMKDMAVTNPTAMFPADEVIDAFAGRRIFIGGKDGNRMANISIFELDEDGLPTRAIFAREASLAPDPGNAGLILHLRHARFEERSKKSGDILGMRQGLMMSEGKYQISPREFLEANRRGNSLAARTLPELREAIAGAQGPEKLRATVEYHRRFSIACACLAFALVAVPLGITAHRRETIVGFGLSLVVAFVYYLCIILAQTFGGEARAHPVFLIWLPNILLVLLGGGLFLRLARR